MSEGISLSAMIGQDEPMVMPDTSETGPAMMTLPPVQPVQQPMMTLAPAVPVPMATAPVRAPVPVAPGVSPWTSFFTAFGQGAQAVAASIKAKPAKAPPIMPIRGGSYAPVSTGPSMTTWILIGGGAVAVLAVAYLLTRN